MPNKGSYAQLKRACRYLIGLPRFVYVYKRQEQPAAIDVVTDTDFAWCKTTRRSTSSSTVHGISKGRQHALELNSPYADLGLVVEITVHSNATAAIGTARRRGLRK